LAGIIEIFLEVVTVEGFVFTIFDGEERGQQTGEIRGII